MNASNNISPEFIQGTQEWLDLRKTKITASDAPIIMGVSKWKTPLQLYNEKKGEGHIRLVGPHVIRGITLEPEARELFCIQNRVQVQPKVIIKEWAMASVDGISDDGKILVEIKCPGKADHELAIRGKIPEHYYPQLQHQMWVCGVDEMFYYSFDGSDGVTIKVYKNDLYTMTMIDKEQAFYERMLNNDPPDCFEMEYKEMKGQLWESCAKRLIEIKSLMVTLTEEEKNIRESLIGMAQHHNAKGHGICLTKIVRPGAVDYQTIPELKNVDVDAYRKPETESWRITS